MLKRILLCSMIYSMKSKTSITISKHLLDQLDEFLGEKKNRSKLIEAALRDYLHRLIRKSRDQREFEIINKHAASLNREAKDALSYQVKM